MQTISLSVLIEKALSQMAQNGYSARMLTLYRSTGFGEIRRRSEMLGEDTFSIELADKLVQEIRIQYEQGLLSPKKWFTVRRGCEILKHLSVTGSVNMPPCKPWEAIHNPLHREPTADELSNLNSVVLLIRRAEQMLRDMNLTEKTLSNYRYDGFDRIMRRHFELGLVDFSYEVTAEVAKIARIAYEDGAMTRSVYQNIRKMANMLTTIWRDGEYSHKCLQKYGLRQLTGDYSALLDGFCVYAQRIGLRSLKTTKASIRGFLFEFENVGVFSLTDISQRVINERAIHFAERFSGGLIRMLYDVRTFLCYLHSCGVTNKNLSVSLPELAAPRRPIQEGFSPEVINKLLAVIDTTTPIGKRDYAIMTLARQTGLRSCDVTNLKRENIDWRQHEIRFVQSKTNTPLTLPLLAETGNAIADYLLNGRPKCDLPYIFISKDNPHRPLKSLHGVVRRYIKRADVTDIVPKRAGFHSFRRAYGKTLLEAETSLDMLSELLGHMDMDSAKPYVAIDEQGLKRCALSLIDTGKVGDVS